MIVSCPGCGTAYKVADGAAASGTKFRCRSCGAVFAAAGAEEPAGSPAVAPEPPPEANAPVALDEVVRRVAPVAAGLPVPPPRRAGADAQGKARRKGRLIGTSRWRRRGGRIPWAVIGSLVVLVLVIAGGILGWRSLRRGEGIQRLLAANLLVAFGGPELIARPAGLAVIPDGRIAVVDREAHLIRVFSPSGEPVAAFGGFGVDDDNLWEPEGLSYAAGKLATFDTGNGSIKVFDLEGRPVAKIPLDGRFYIPRDLSFGEDGTVVVADTGNHRLVVLAPDGSVRSEIGKRGEGRGELGNPYSVARIPGGGLAVADVGNNRITLFGVDGSAGASWRYEGSSGQYTITPSLAWLPGVNLLALADQHLQRLQLFDLEGRLAGIVGKRDDGRQVFEGAGPILVDSARPGEMVVLTERGRVFVFSY